MKTEQLKEARIERKRIINQHLRESYKSEMINGTECFFLPSGTVVHLESMGDEFNAIVVGYAENRRDAEKNMFEDGDLFYMDEMSEEEMISAVTREIEEDG